MTTKQKNIDYHSLQPQRNNSHSLEQLCQNLKNAGIQRKKRQKDGDHDPVQVQLLSLKEVPEPLSRHDFGEICRLEGLPIDSPRIEKNFQKDLMLDSNKIQWENTYNNLFGAYMAIYEQFKKWHQEIIENNNIVGPRT